MVDVDLVIKLDNSDTEIRLSRKDAEELYHALERVFGNNDKDPITTPYYPYYMPRTIPSDTLDDIKYPYFPNILWC